MIIFFLVMQDFFQFIHFYVKNKNRAQSTLSYRVSEKISRETKEFYEYIDKKTR